MPWGDARGSELNGIVSEDVSGHLSNLLLVVEQHMCVCYMSAMCRALGVYYLFELSQQACKVGQTLYNLEDAEAQKGLSKFL